MSLTDNWLKANNGKICEKEYVKSDGDGLGARVSPRGKIVFQFRYRFNKKSDRLDLGTYPYLSLKDARIKREEVRAKIQAGINPKAELVPVNVLNDLLATKRDLTFQEVFNIWMEKWCSKNKQSHHEVNRSFQIHIFESITTEDVILPSLADVPADALTTAIWLDRLEAIAENTYSIAERILINVKQCYEWGKKRDYFTHDPVKDISGEDDLMLERGTRNRHFSDQEIYLVVLAAQSSRMLTRNKLLLILCLFYGCRVGEFRLAKKGDFDFENKIWTVPADNHKTGRITGEPLVRPIIDEIAPYLHELIALAGDNDYLFADKNNVLVKNRFHLSIPSGINTWLLNKRGYDMEKWSFHVLRKTCRTNMSAFAAPHICEIMLGHALPKMWRTYDFYEYIDEQREGYTKWFYKLTEIMNNHTFDVQLIEELKPVKPDLTLLSPPKR